MAEEKRYYWLKLKRDFFKRHDVRIIEAMPNGKDYILFYLKLLLESVDHEGKLRFNDTIPYNEQMLSVVTETNIDIVRSALKVFSELDLVSVFDDQTIYMNEVEKLIGSETEWAKKKRLYREKMDAERTLSSDCPPPVHSLSDKSKRIEKENTTTTSTFSVGTRAREDELRRRDGFIGKGVLYLSDNQYNALLVKLGIEMFQYYADKLCAFIEDTGATVKNHYATILKWYDEDCACDAAPSPEEVEAVYRDREEMVRDIIGKRKCEDENDI